MKCESCGNKIKGYMTYCPHCGKLLRVEKSERVKEFEEKYIYVKHVKPVVRSRAFSAILALFFGTFGFQHIYNGHTALGIICAAFCWTGIPTFFGIINCIQYVACNSDEEFTEKYCITREENIYTTY